MYYVAKFETSLALTYFMNDMRIDPELINVLKSQSVNWFTVAKLTQAYLDNPNSRHKAKQSARQFIYRNIKRLLQEELIISVPGERGWPIYQLSPKFDEGIQPGEQTPPTMPHQTGQRRDHDAKKIHNSTIKTLKKRLGNYRSDMLCTLGEAAEYQELSNELPGLSEETHLLYEEACERSTSLLGKIKALEIVLQRRTRTSG